MRRLFFSLVLGLAASSAVAAPAPFAKPDRPDRASELRPFRGEWSYVTWAGRFNALSSWHIVRARVVIAGDRLRCYSVTTHVPDRDATIRIDGKRDVTFTTERGARPGIYKFDGDTLTVCIAAPGKPRPSAFSLENDGDEIISLSRKPPIR